MNVALINIHVNINNGRCLGDSLIDNAPNKRAILQACRLPDQRNIYIIGTFARRVSFATQQRRSFNLAKAVDDDIKNAGDAVGLKGKNIAVVGYGLAGITASYAFGALGAIVYPFEKLTESMAHVASASHRYIHPTINFWPQERLYQTTAFPALNWWRQNCPTVKTQVDKEEERLREINQEFLENIMPPRYGIEVTKILKAEGNKHSLEIEKSGKRNKKSAGRPKMASFTNAAGQRREDFDIVVLATGFGSDDTKSSTGGKKSNQIDHFTPGYWDGTADFLARKKSFSDYEQVVVMGCGDGGLIEIIRLLWGDMFDNSDFAKFVAELTQDEDGNPARYIREKEAEATKLYFDAQMHGSPTERSLILQEISVFLQDTYLEIFAFEHDRLNRLRELHEAHYARMNKEHGNVPKKIVLCGLASTPFELGVAPIHKLLLAAARKLSLAKYERVAHNWKKRPTPSLAEKFEKARKERKDERPKPQDLTLFKFEPITTKNYQKMVERVADAKKRVADAKKKAKGNRIQRAPSLQMSIDNGYVFYTHVRVDPLEACLLLERQGASPDLSMLSNMEPSPESGDTLAKRIRRLQLMYSDNDWLDPITFETFEKAIFGSAVKSAAEYNLKIAEKFFEKAYGHGVYIERGKYIAYPNDTGVQGASEPGVSIALHRDLPKQFFSVPVVPRSDPPTYRALKDEGTTEQEPELI